MRDRRAAVALPAALALAALLAGAQGLAAFKLRARDEPFRAEERFGGEASEAGQTLPLANGTPLGELLIDDAWSDFRGQTIVAGRYSLRYALQPRLKEHVGVDQIRDFALLVAPETEIASGEGATEAWIAASRRVSGTRHPAVLALVAWRSSGDPPPEPVTEGERLVLFRRIGTDVVGFVVRGRADEAEGL